MRSGTISTNWSLATTPLADLEPRPSFSPRALPQVRVPSWISARRLLRILPQAVPAAKCDGAGAFHNDAPQLLDFKMAGDLPPPRPPEDFVTPRAQQTRE